MFSPDVCCVPMMQTTIFARKVSTIVIQKLHSIELGWNLTSRDLLIFVDLLRFVESSSRYLSRLVRIIIPVRLLGVHFCVSQQYFFCAIFSSDTLAWGGTVWNMLRHGSQGSMPISCLPSWWYVILNNLIWRSFGNL